MTTPTHDQVAQVINILLVKQVLPNQYRDSVDRGILVLAVTAALEEQDRINRS